MHLREPPCKPQTVRMAESIHPDDVVRAAQYVVGALRPGFGRDWSVRAGRLDWDVDFTVTHIASALAKYTLYLASRSTRFLAIRPDRWPDASMSEQLDAIAGAARALANVAETSPPGARAFHANGMFDAEGYVSLGCVETLVHGHDAASGLGLPFDPPDDLCRAVVARSFPWLVDAGPAWETILWQTGRLEIAGRPSNTDDTWTLLAEPLDEWDGTVPDDDPRIVAEWIHADGGWKPRYLEER